LIEMRLVIAGSTIDSEPLLTKLHSAPTLDVVGISHPDPDVRQRLERLPGLVTAPNLDSLRRQIDAEAIVLAPGYSPASASEEAPISVPSGSFLSSTNNQFVTHLLTDVNEHGAKSRALLPSLHRHPYTLLRESLGSERVGSPRFLRWTSWWPGLLAVRDLLIDELVAVLTLMGRTPMIAYAVSHSIAADTDNYLVATLTFEHGLTAALDIGAALAGGHPFNRVMIVGANGSIHTDSRASSITRLGHTTASPLDIAEPLDAYVRAVEAFTRDDNAANKLALGALRTADAILSSCASGCPVQITTRNP
jgi:hypothetical protein